MPIPKDPIKYQEWKDKISISLKGNIPWNKGKVGLQKPTKETRKKMSEAQKGKIVSEETRKKLSQLRINKKLSEETKKKISKSVKKAFVNNPELRNNLRIIRKMDNSHKGINSNFWKGGITPENQRIRNSIEFHLWREAVFARDNWICQKCKIRGGEIHSHHIYNFSDYKKLRTSIENGITLCKKCHQEFHKKYGVKNNTKEQLEEFLTQA